MAGRPQNNIRKLTRVGSSPSMGVIIPAEHIRSLGWRERQRLIVKKVPRGILIVDAKTKKKVKLETRNKARYTRLYDSKKL